MDNKKGKETGNKGEPIKGIGINCSDFSTLLQRSANFFWKKTESIFDFMSHRVLSQYLNSAIVARK